MAPDNEMPDAAVFLGQASQQSRLLMSNIVHKAFCSC